MEQQPLMMHREYGTANTPTAAATPMPTTENASADRRRTRTLVKMVGAFALAGGLAVFAMDGMTPSFISQPNAPSSAELATLEASSAGSPGR